MYKYYEIYSDIKRNILTNHYRAGTSLPTQDFFSKKYGVSRITLKKALNLLENEGLIFSKQGAGTFVRSKIKNNDSELLPLDLPIGTTYSHRDQKISSKILSFDARLPSKKEQDSLKIKSSEPIYQFKRIRFINDNVYSLECAIMPTEIAPLSEIILEGSVYDYLGSTFNIKVTDARRVIYATKADDEISRALEVKKGDAILAIEQTAYDQKGIAFEFSTSYFISNKSKFLLDIHIKN